ncbi:MAG: acetyl-CoA acetyltransferase, partial [Dehalococcoidia bacterium]|nr:acetyl-CoA acetyltransferase [Dehalococcoidia bacterium]
ESIKDKVAIVGMGCCKFGENWEQGPEDMIIEAAYEAYQDAGIDPKQIQAAWMGTVGAHWIGMAGLPVAEALKLHGIPISRVEAYCATGHEALRHASLAVASGLYDVALALGFEKLKDSGFAGLGVGRGMHPVVEVRRTSPASFAFAATRYFHTYGLTLEQGKRLLAKISVKNHKNGVLSPKAHMRKEVTIEQVLSAPIIASPLGLFDCCGNSDGSAAAIVVRAELAHQFRRDPIYIKGLGQAQVSMAPHFQPGYHWTGFDATRFAAQQAYAQAGVKDPRKEVSLAEVHDCFTITELVNYEDLGLSPKGGAKEDIEAGTFELNGALPVNSDGGLKSFGHPVGASGLRMTYELYKQLQGKAQMPERQLKNPTLGLAHTLGGHPSVSCVVLCGKEKG